MVVGGLPVATGKSKRRRVRPEVIPRCFYFLKNIMKIQLSDHFTYKRLLRFVMPSVVMMVFISIYSIVDGLFISNYVGETAVAAINLIFPLIMILGSVGFMLGAGGSALVAKTLGEGDNKRAKEYFSLLVYVTAGIGMIIMIAGQFAVPWCAQLLSQSSDGEIYEYCVLYARILLAGQPFFILQNIFQSFFVTAEKPRLGLAVTAGAGIMNMVLDAVLVAGFGLGLKGAAWATFSSEVFGGIVPVFYFAFKNTSLLRFTKTKFYLRAILKSATNGLSEFLSNVSASIVIMLYNAQLLNFAGKPGVAAYAAIGYVSMIFFSVFMGFAVGATPVIGFNYGAQNKDELKNLFKKCLVVVGVAGLLMTVLSEALALPLVNIFNYSPEVKEITLRGHYIFSISYLIGGFGVFGSALFTALNNGLISGVISIVRSLVLRIIAVMVLPLFWGLDGVWASSVISEIFALAVTFIFIAACRKKYGYA